MATGVRAGGAWVGAAVGTAVALGLGVALGARVAVAVALGAGVGVAGTVALGEGSGASVGRAGRQAPRRTALAASWMKRRREMAWRVDGARSLMVASWQIP